MLTRGNKAKSGRCLAFLGWALLLTAWTAGGWADEPPGTASPELGRPELGLMELRDGSVLRGDFAVTAGGSHLLWRSPSFDTPFQMRLPAVSAIHFPIPTASESAPANTAPAWNFELAGGGLLRGELVAFNDQVVRIRTEGLGESLEIERRLVERMSRPQLDGDVVFPGLREIGRAHV